MKVGESAHYIWEFLGFSESGNGIDALYLRPRCSDEYMRCSCSILIMTCSTIQGESQLEK